MNGIKTFYGNVPGAPSPSTTRTSAGANRPDGHVSPSAAPAAAVTTPPGDGVTTRLRVRRHFGEGEGEAERTAELERLKQAIRDGRLVIRPERIADAMIKHSLEFIRNRNYA